MEPKKTPFYQKHVDAGAKMVEFAGYMMPIQFKGITSEHLAVRENVGLFDLTHMGEFLVTGNDALDFMQKVTTNNVEALKVGDIQYSCMTQEDGGFVDDLLVYNRPEGYFLVVNASNLEKDYNWLQDHLFGDVTLTDNSDNTALLAIQGPNAIKVMAELTDYDLDNMRYYTSAKHKVGGEDVLFSRTGYTGEDGFEIYMPYDKAGNIWKAVNDAGAKHGMEQIGLGARDSLRLEMKMALYGNDMDETINPIEAGLSWIVNLNKEFIGKDVIAKVKAEKPSRRLVCLEIEGRAFPRHGYDIYVDNKKAGHVTSGTFSPSLKKPIALGYVPRSHSKSGSSVEIEIRGKRFPATVVKPPFYKDASHK
ncbi:MAG: glycine cleavage system aminomethyltransferase GcvT [candidate division Zixibacteria bacterium]|nr:glycine cleavage system aminomethyltransferase GcvT [candidate division Zixibacteria bacterium]